MIVDRVAYLVAALRVTREAVSALAAETVVAPDDPGLEGVVLAYEAAELGAQLVEETQVALHHALALRPFDRDERLVLHMVGVERARAT